MSMEQSLIDVQKEDIQYIKDNIETVLLSRVGVATPTPNEERLYYIEVRHNILSLESISKRFDILSIVYHNRLMTILVRATKKVK